MTSRRTFIAGIVLAPTAIAAPAAALASLRCQPADDSGAWEASMSAFLTLKKEDRSFHDEIFAPVMDPIHELSPPYRFQHVAKNGNVASYCFDGPDLARCDTNWGGLWFGIRDQMDEARAKYTAWLDAMSKVDTDSLNDKSDALGSAIYEAERELLAMPAPHLLALEWKVELLREQSADSAASPSDLGLILRDIRRLDGRASH